MELACLVPFFLGAPKEPNDMYFYYSMPPVFSQFVSFIVTYIIK